MKRSVGRPAALPPVSAPPLVDVPKVLHSRGACGGHEDVFDDETRVEEAKAICTACPVRDRCLAYGLNSEEFGVWGGLAPEERAAVRGRPFVHTLEQRQAAARLRTQLAQGMTLAQIAAAWQVSTRTVERWAAAQRSSTTAA